MRGNRQVQGRRLPLVDAASHVISRTMARAEIATQPFGAQIGCCHFRTESRGTAEVSTESNDNQQLGLDRTNLRVDVGRLLGRFRVRVGNRVGQLAQVGNRLLATTQDEYRLPAPLGDHLLARLNLADIHLNRCPGRLGLGTWKPRSHKRDRGPHRSCSTHYRSSSYQEATPASIHAVIAHSVVSHQFLMAYRKQASTT